MTAAASEDEAKLSRMILERPDDLEPRLVFADWLLARGDPRGHLIEMQCRLEQLPERHRDRMGLSLRIRKLVAERGIEMAGEVAMRAASYEFSRGMVEKVTMTATSFAKHGEGLFDLHPIRTLRLRPLDSAAMRVLADAPALDRLRRLELQTFAGVGVGLELRFFARSEHLGALEELTIDHCDLDPEDLERAFADLRAPRLSRIHVSGAPFSPRSLAGLEQNPAPPPLVTLHITAPTPCEPAELRGAAVSLGHAPGAAKIEDVHLDGWRGVPWPLDDWLGGPNAAMLRRLSLGGTIEGDAIAAAIARSETLGPLTSLRLDKTSLTKSGLARIMATRLADSLEELRVPPWLIPSVPERLR